MSKINGKSVTKATLHNAIFINGVGNIRQELSNTADGLNKAVKMTVDEPFLVLEIEDTKTRRNYVVPVPLTNVSHMVLSSEANTGALLKE